MNPSKTTKYTAHFDWALFFTLPLGYYVSWLNWVTWLNVAVVTIMFVVVGVMLMLNTQNLVTKYKEEGITELPDFKFSWKSVVCLISIGLMYGFGWELSAWLSLAGWTVTYFAMREVRNEIRRR